MEITLPQRIKVEKVVAGRYAPGCRPISWDVRREGLEEVITTDGAKFCLFSDGGQSTPAPGWELLLEREREVPGMEPAYIWTLYGIGKTSPN